MLKQATDYSNIYLFMTRSKNFSIHLHLGLLKPRYASIKSHIVAVLQNNFFVLLPTLNHYMRPCQGKLAQKVATARKMKSRQETTSLGQIATVTSKPTISYRHL